MQLFRERLSDESLKRTRQDRMVVWVFIGILYMGAEEIYKFVFWTWSIGKITFDFETHKTLFEKGAALKN